MRGLVGTGLVACDTSDSPPDPKVLQQYQSIVGAINYCATHTRCDVALATGLLSRAMHCPTPELLLAAQRVLGYLYRTRHLGLFYEADELPMSGMSDSDWAVKHSTSDENISDFFTKVLPPRMFVPMRNKIMNISEADSEATS